MGDGPFVPVSIAGCPSTSGIGMGLSDCCPFAGWTAVGVWTGSLTACCGAAAAAGAGFGAAGAGVLEAVDAGGGVDVAGADAGALDELLGVAGGCGPGRVMPGPAFGSAAPADLGTMS